MNAFCALGGHAQVTRPGIVCACQPSHRWNSQPVHHCLDITFTTDHHRLRRCSLRRGRFVFLLASPFRGPRGRLRASAASHCRSHAGAAASSAGCYCRRRRCSAVAVAAAGRTTSLPAPAMQQPCSNTLARLLARLNLQRRGTMVNAEDWRCCTCLDLLFKPAVNSCGHVFW